MTGFKYKFFASLLVLIVFAMPGCNAGVETSAVGYEHLKSLYQISNQRDAEQLEVVASKIESDQDSGKLSAAESESLLEVVGDARDGEWKTANQAARRLMEAQVHTNSQ